MLICLVSGNPVSVLQTQTNLDLIPVKHKCPMYECSQNVVSGRCEVSQSTREGLRLLLVSYEIFQTRGIDPPSTSIPPS